LIHETLAPSRTNNCIPRVDGSRLQSHLHPGTASIQKFNQQ
jgi:hypothetical protein